MDDELVKRRKAVALRYDTDRDDAPKVVAKGSGYIAERIVALAAEHELPVHEDPDLVGLLSKLEVDTEIPPNLYKAVAEVLAFVYRLNDTLLPEGAR
jgi:flagellar biosynthesis protein